MQWFKDYLISPTHKWWVDNVWRPSWTRLVTSIYGIPAGIIAVFEAISKFAGDTTIQGYLAQFNIPNWVPMAFAGIGLVSYIAHGRD